MVREPYCPKSHVTAGVCARVVSGMPRWKPWDEMEQVANHNGNTERSRTLQTLLDSLLAQWAHISRSRSDDEIGVARFRTTKLQNNLPH